MQVKDWAKRQNICIFKLIKQLQHTACIKASVFNVSSLIHSDVFFILSPICRHCTYMAESKTGLWLNKCHPALMWSNCQKIAAASMERVDTAVYIAVRPLSKITTLESIYFFDQYELPLQLLCQMKMVSAGQRLIGQNQAATSEAEKWSRHGSVKNCSSSNGHLRLAPKAQLTVQ